jgi:hypothetical protein
LAAEAVKKRQHSRGVLQVVEGGDRSDSDDKDREVGEAEVNEVALAKRTAGFRVKRGILISMPCLLTMATVIFYCLAIFNLYNAYDHTAWKISVSLFALLVKVAGNKLHLKLVTFTAPPAFVADSMLFGYEFSTAMLCRLLQLSIPDQTAAQMLSQTSAMLEMGTRVFFHNLYLKDGMKAKMMSEELSEKYRRRGHMRVQDNSNDMVVEYVSSTCATFVLVVLSPTGAFTFTQTATDQNQVLMVCLFQIVPEIVLDFYCTFIEVFCGLSELHAEYWTVLNKHGEGLSVFVMSILLKLVLVFLVTLVLLTVALK